MVCSSWWLCVAWTVYVAWTSTSGLLGRQELVLLDNSVCSLDLQVRVDAIAAKKAAACISWPDGHPDLEVQATYTVRLHMSLGY